MDSLFKMQRHANMAAIKSKGTKPELLVRRFLWAQGFRYRLNSPRLPGHPDLVLRKYRTCIFVNGCFWHGHQVRVEFAGFLRPQIRFASADDLAAELRRNVEETKRLTA